MKNWQKTVVTLAALIYLDQEIIPWATTYVRYGKGVLQAANKIGIACGEAIVETLDEMFRKEDS